MDPEDVIGTLEAKIAELEEEKAVLEEELEEKDIVNNDLATENEQLRDRLGELREYVESMVKQLPGTVWASVDIKWED